MEDAVRHVANFEHSSDGGACVLEYKERGNDRQAERRCRQALYLAPGYLPALELLQTLWHTMHPNPRLRRALTARILRVRMESETLLPAQRLAEGETA